MSGCRLSTLMEKRLQQLWADVIGIEASAINAGDNFLRLGGDSITAMRLVASARHQNLALTVADVFRAPVLEDMAECVRYEESESSSLQSIAPFSLLSPDVHEAAARRHAARACSVDGSRVTDVYPCTALQEGLLALGTREHGQQPRPAKILALELFQDHPERVAVVCAVVHGEGKVAVDDGGGVVALWRSDHCSVVEEVNDRLVQELEKRDDAIRDAVAMIVSLEATVEKLQKERDIIRSLSAETYDQLPEPEDPDEGAFTRMPSFINDPSAKTENLRNAYLAPRANTLSFKRASNSAINDDNVPDYKLMKNDNGWASDSSENDNINNGATVSTYNYWIRESLKPNRAFPHNAAVNIDNGANVGGRVSPNFFAFPGAANGSGGWSSETMFGNLGGAGFLGAGTTSPPTSHAFNAIGASLPSPQAGFFGSGLASAGPSASTTVPPPLRRSNLHARTGSNPTVTRPPSRQAPTNGKLRKSPVRSSMSRSNSVDYNVQKPPTPTLTSPPTGNTSDPSKRHYPPIFGSQQQHVRRLSGLNLFRRSIGTVNRERETGSTSAPPSEVSLRNAYPPPMSPNSMAVAANEHRNATADHAQPKPAWRWLSVDQEGFSDAFEDLEQLPDRVPQYMVPGAYIEIDQIPMTTTNKTDRRALRELGSAKTLEELAWLQLS
ncbi:uncharacterized protein PpBr36_10375 [Pyricularia pennisetigena]|uniref:uncharacterized protein n=1 Tax=Pyricularia pennisetigena TaxID=1578925 RepID=UPI00114DA0A6|nr:uncharacterized protein PpBr36_10375 [Pyricularia pennisetigena]TLS21558.1 hypothetical protein PpBr36_10375 [Pyricularia pennisetigena]